MIKEIVKKVTVAYNKNLQTVGYKAYAKAQIMLAIKRVIMMKGDSIKSKEISDDIMEQAEAG